MSECLLFIRLLHHRRCFATSDTHVGRGAVLTDYRLIAYDRWPQPAAVV